ncbi:MAG: translation initiation factor [Flavobacteriaceae bacterium]|jgi:translation initiation factor 1
MSAKKISSFEELSKIQFENLAPDPDPLPESPEVFEKQTLEAHFSNKGRAGKTVTLIKGFEGEHAELKALAKTLKNEFKVGGTVKNGEIVIQGNMRDKLIAYLKSLGHEVKRVGG